MHAGVRATDDGERPLACAEHEQPDRRFIARCRPIQKAAEGRLGEGVADAHLRELRRFPLIEGRERSGDIGRVDPAGVQFAQRGQLVALLAQLLAVVPV